MSDFLIDSFDPEIPARKYEEAWREELRFNKYDLDEEFIRQPDLFMHWVKLYTGAMTAKRRAENELDRIKAVVDLEVRKDPENFGLVPDSKGKVMEGAIKATILKDERVTDRTEALYRVREIHKMLELAVESFRQRKELLKGEAELWINGYYTADSFSSKKVMERDSDRSQARQDLAEETGDRVPTRRRKPLE